jgi:hypothetical protein
MATALPIWDWLSPATGAELVDDGDADGSGADGGCGDDADSDPALPVGAGVGLSLRDAPVPVVAAPFAYPASTGLATVAASGVLSATAFAGEPTFHKTTPIPASAMLATTPPTRGRVFDLFAWRPGRERGYWLDVVTGS